MQLTSRIAKVLLPELTTHEVKNEISLLTPSTIALKFSHQEVKVLISDRQNLMIILSYMSMSDKHHHILSWLNSPHPLYKTIVSSYIPSYKKDWMFHINYIHMYDDKKVAFGIQYISGSMAEVINCTAKDSISCLQDAANDDSKGMTALGLMNNPNNHSNASGGPYYLRQESSNSSIHCDSALLDNDIDDSGMSVAIESDISSMDRDVRVVRRKKMTDPSPAYRLQFYAQRFWRHEQIDSNETDFYVPTESSVIDADESESGYDIIENTNRTPKQKSKISSRRQLKDEYQNQINDLTSDDSHWSIFLL